MYSIPELRCSKEDEEGEEEKEALAEVPERKRTSVNQTTRAKPAQECLRTSKHSNALWWSPAEPDL